MENNEDDFNDEDPSDDRKVKFVRAILLFTTLVIIAVSVYTTVQIFGIESNSNNPQLSPNEAAKFNLPKKNTGPGANFDIKQEQKPDEFSDETKTYENKEVKPFENGPIQTSPIYQPGNAPITPLVIYNEEQFKKDRLVWALILVEVFVIFAIYRKVDGFLQRKS